MSHQNSPQPNSRKSTFVVLLSLIVILGILFGLNSLLVEQNKSDTQTINSLENDFYLKGDPQAKVRLVEYADFQCPACKFYSGVLKKLYQEINDQYGSSSLSIAYKHFPLIQIHKNAFQAAYAAEAALKQGKFWEMHDLIFEKQADWSEQLDARSIFETYAMSLGLDLNQFRLDRDSEETQNKVSQAYKEGVRIGLSYTPTIFLNGSKVTNQDGYEGLKAAILEKLNLASSTVKE